MRNNCKAKWASTPPVDYLGTTALPPHRPRMFLIETSSLTCSGSIMTFHSLRTISIKLKKDLEMKKRLKKMQNLKIFLKRPKLVKS